MYLQKVEVANSRANCGLENMMISRGLSVLNRFMFC